MSPSTTCPACQARLPSGAAFCTTCGARLSDFSSSAPVPAPRPGWLPWVLLFLLLNFCGLLALGAVFLWKESQPSRSLPPLSLPTAQSPPAATAQPATRPEPSPVSSPPSALAPSPAFSSPTLPVSSPTPRLARAQISNEIYFAALRQSPGFRGKNDKTDVLAKVPAGEVVQILLSEPQSVDDLAWWYVSWGGVKGWMADHTGSGKVILLFLP